MDFRYVQPSLERLWAEEVLYLHDLWRRGPPNPSPGTNIHSNPNLLANSSVIKKKRRGRKKQQQQNSRSVQDQRQPSNPPVPENEWPCEPIPAANPESPRWDDLIPPVGAAQSRPAPSTEEQARVAAERVQQNGFRACHDFFSKKNESSSDDEEENDMDEDNEDDESEAFKFFLGLFEGDRDLRDFYEKNCEKGAFCCLVCEGIGEKKGKRFSNCLGLVQHSNSISKTKRKGLHRAFGRAVCRVLGWDTSRLPSIVLDLRESLGKSLAKPDNSEKEEVIEGIMLMSLRGS